MKQNIYLGIDCGTQSSKIILIDSQRRQILGHGHAPHPLDEGHNGRREQHPRIWTDALQSAYRQALHTTGIDPRAIAGIGISGQQHGLVILDENDQPLYPAKLWCDTETAIENREYLHALGGDTQAFKRLGILCQTGYTASKILWIRKHHPDLYRRIAKILLPHDYLNYWLTGTFAGEAGDASGTGYFDIKTRTWAHDTFAHLAPDLDPERVLPRLIEPHAILGTVKPDIARLLGLRDNVIVAGGSGDNMMGAIGTANIAPGHITMSLGTSGTLYTWTERPCDLPPDIANFCAGNGGWLPLICVMNLTAAIRRIQTLLDIDLTTFSHHAAQSPIGAAGLILLPFFNGERIPNLPHAQAAIFGMNSANTTRDHLCRAALESAGFTLRYGLDIFRRAGLPTDHIRLIGGAAKSTQWRQMIADLMHTHVSVLREEEAAALGAAIQAMWANGEDSLPALCDSFVQYDGAITTPNPAHTAAYEDAYRRYREQLAAQYSV